MKDGPKCHCERAKRLKQSEIVAKGSAPLVIYAESLFAPVPEMMCGHSNYLKGMRGEYSATQVAATDTRNPPQGGLRSASRA